MIYKGHFKNPKKHNNWGAETGDPIDEEQQLRCSSRAAK